MQQLQLKAASDAKALGRSEAQEEKEVTEAVGEVDDKSSDDDEPEGEGGAISLPDGAVFPGEVFGAVPPTPPRGKKQKLAPPAKEAEVQAVIEHSKCYRYASSGSGPAAAAQYEGAGTPRKPFP